MTTLALIGNGRWGKNYLETAAKRNDCVIKYVCTKDYQDLRRYQDIDGIIIATPAPTHAAIIDFFADKPLLVEKPLTTDLLSAQAITNQRIMVGHTWLYNRALLAQLEDIYDIRTVCFLLCNTDAYESPTTPLWELGPHGVALCIWLLGLPQAVTAHHVGQNVLVQLTYENDKVATIECGWSYPKRVKSLLVAGSKVVFFADNIEQPVSPLASQLEAFIGFIHGQPTKTGLAHALKVQQVLDLAEQSLYANDHYFTNS